MTTKTYPRKLDLSALAQDKWHSDEWIAHPAGRPNSRSAQLSAYNHIINSAEDITVHAEYDRPDPYEYEMWALIDDGEGSFYVLETSGCSCPSPTETWVIDQGPGTRETVEADFIAEHLSKDSYGRERMVEVYRALFQGAK